MKKLATRVGIGGTAFLPAVALAQFGDINTFFGKITTFINDILIPLIFALALLMFIWGMFRFFIAGGHDEDAREKGKNLMLYAVVGFVLMVSIFGIVNLIANGLGFSKQQDINNIPNVPTSNR
ncbi:MAG: pilin [Candidatus Paceibacterota bacterium]